MTTDSAARQPKGIPVGGQFAATAHSEPDVSLTPAPKKVTSKGVLTTVTLPDGSIAKRTSQNGHYTHAVVRGPEEPKLVIANREHQIADSEKTIKDIDEALALEKPIFKIRNRGFRDKNPDLRYDGTPSYHGFEAHLMSADGKRSLYSTHCNSKGLSEGVYNYDTKTYDGKAIQAAPTSIRNAVTEQQRNARETITLAAADIEAVKAGTFELGGPYVARWSSRQDLAEKAMNSSDLKHDYPTRGMYVTPVD
jgi:hypothetical protein